ncbi:hypothetical protein [Hoeflea sp.]|uniref:hypothetical protein n=1 Tax=Hoeflea sp. TaxID=1940281 RepID=UPI003B019F6D
MTTGTAKRRNVSLVLAAAATGVLLCGGERAQAAPDVGVAAAVNLNANSIRGGGAPKVVTLGQPIIFNERIVTDTSGLVQILLVDGTTFTIGPGCELTIDEFVYNPNTGDAKVVATIAKGAFRFIGGQTSRSRDGAKINTPVGTIGIRGGVLTGDCPTSDCTFTSLSGDAELTDNSGRKRAFGGLTVKTSDNGKNTKVAFTTEEDIQDAQDSTTGSDSQNGSSSRIPDNEGVVDSGIAKFNTESEQVQTEIAAQGSGLLETSDTDEADESITDDAAQGDIQDDAVFVSVPGRVYTAPDVYNTDYGGTIVGGGSRGLVGSTPETEFNVDLGIGSGQLTGTSPFGGFISIPDLTGSQGDNGLESISVSGTSPVGPISGTAYAGAGDFAAYMLGINGQPTDPYYIIAGTATDLSFIAGQSSDVRVYSLTNDPIQNIGVPFFSPVHYGSLDNTSQTDLLIVETGSIYFQSFLTWADISGSGSNQRSAILVTAGGGSDFPGGTNARLSTNRRGSYRGTAAGPQLNIRGGGIETIPGANGHHVFGANAENFVVGTAIDPLVSAFYDIPTDICFFYDCSSPVIPEDTDLVYSTHHVADLVSETAKPVSTRSTPFATGFMVGMAEPRTEGYFNPYIVVSTGPFNLAFDEASSTIAASGTVTDINNANSVVDSMFIPFGFYNGDFGASTFVDDDTYGATHNGNSDNTRLITDDGQNVPADKQVPGSYIVSGRAAPIPGYKHCTQCDFADWGWWGTRVVADYDDNGNTLRRDEKVHMGTWVAGDITSTADLPGGATNASYLGTAIANIASSTGDQYIATGDFSLNIDLSNRSGNLAINGLDGANYTATVSDASVGGLALYSGSLTGVTNGITGGVTGALVNDGAAIAAGTIGQFHAAGSGNQVVGTFMGKQ